MNEDHKIAEALASQKRVLDDFKKLEQHISPELRQALEATMSPETRVHVLSLTLLAIQHGRGLEQEDMISKVMKAPEHMQVLIKEVLTGTKERKIVVAGDGHSSSALVRQLMNNIDRSKH